MLNRTNKSQSVNEVVRELGNAPANAFTEATLKFFEIHGSLKVENSRLFLFVILSVILNFLLGLAIYRMVPLKTVVPYSIVLSQDKGAVAQRIEAKAFYPDDNIKIYFLNKFIDNMRGLDPYQTRKNIQLARDITRDKAVDEFNEYMTKERPIERIVADKTLIRTVKFLSTNPGTKDNNIAFIRTIEEERSANGVTRKTYMFTVHYTVIPPASDEEVTANPAGLYVTHFDKREEQSVNP